MKTRDLLTEESSKQIARIMQSSVVHVLKSSSLEEVLQIFKTYSFFALPVTDDSERLVGIIPVERVQKYLGPTTVRPSFYQFAGLSREEVERKSIFEIILKRLPWLLLSVTSGLVCAYILGLFIGKVESVIALILFVPIILGLAGSIGTQSAAIINRRLGEGRLALAKLFQILVKEIAIGLSLGGIAFFVAALIAVLWRKSPAEGIALGVSIVVVVTSSGILGMILPFFFKVLRMDSKVASGLFLLLICDIFALILYFWISLSLVNPTLELG